MNHLRDIDARLAALLRAPRLMGIVNVTPNSFSDTGQHLAPSAAIAHATQLSADGAAVLDLGAEASSFFRPGVAPIDPATQLARLATVLSALSTQHSALLSIDTRSSIVAKEAIAAGAHLINDISAGTHDPDMLATAAQLACPIILMHISPTYPDNPAHDDPDILATVRDYLASRIDAAVAAGVARHRILIDPGIGFGKTPADNWRLVDRIAELLPLAPIVLGVSRKRFLTTRPLDIPAPLRDASAHERDPATAAVTAIAARQGVHLHRVHNVALCAKAIHLGYNPASC